MFPVLSLLRRAATSVIYVRPTMLQATASGLIYPSPTVVTVLEVSRVAWASSKGVPFFALTARARSPEAAAVALTRRENAIAEKAGLLDRTYTLLVGAEKEEVLEGTVTRTAPLAVVQGLFRLRGAVSFTVPAEPSKALLQRRGPRGPQGQPERR